MRFLKRLWPWVRRSRLDAVIAASAKEIAELRARCDRNAYAGKVFESQADARLDIITKIKKLVGNYD